MSNLRNVILMISLVVVGLYLIPILESCDKAIPEPQLKMVEITEDGWTPPWMPQALCDTVSGIRLYAPEATFAGVTDGYIYSGGQILASWVEGGNPYEVLADLLDGDYCEQTVEQMGMLTISGYVDVVVAPDELYWIVVEVSGHPQPYALLVGQ